MLVDVQVSVRGLYLPPVLNKVPLFHPPHTIISLPAQTALCSARGVGALVVLVAVQVSLQGLYIPPLFKYVKLVVRPPQMIILLPIQSAV
jgi:hypothetical protein